MVLTLVLIALFPLSADDQNEINQKNEENCLSDMYESRTSVTMSINHTGRVSLITFFRTSKESNGSRRSSEALQGQGYPIGRYQARSLMRKLNLVAKPTKLLRSRQIVSTTTLSRRIY